MQQGSAHLIILGAFFIGLVGALGFLYWDHFIQNRSIVNEPQQTNNKTYTLTGTVTAGNGGLADAGNHLTVDGLLISTGGGSLSTNPAKYISDISNIRKGDRVEVRYVKDQQGNANTDCESCYVKKL